MIRTGSRSVHLILALVLFLGLTSLAAGQGGELVFEDLDGKLTRRPQAAVSVGDLQHLAAVVVRFDGFEPAASPVLVLADRAEVRLTSGDLVRGRLAGGQGDLLHTELVGGALLVVEIDRITSIVFPGRVPADRPGGLTPGDGTDRLYWKRAGGLDRVDGTIESFGEGGVKFESVLGSKDFPWDEIAGLFVAAFEEAPVAEGDAGTRVAVDLIDGSRLRGRLVSLDGAGCALEFAGGLGITLPLASLSELVVDDGRVAFLSDLTPDRVEEASAFGDDLGMRWPHRMDRAVGGGPLVAGGRRYAHGIGVHAPSRLTWALDGTWTELRGAIAIDDSVLLLPHQGSVEFRLLLDGELAWASGTVRGGQAPRTLPALDLTGKRELTLEVDMDSEFHVADRADWLRMMLVRGS